MASFSGQGAASGAAGGAAMGTMIMPGWGTAVGAVAGGLLGAFGGPSSGDEKALKKEQEYLNYMKALSLEQPKAEQARLTAGFQTNLATLGLLGQPGTYDLPPGAMPSALPGGLLGPPPGAGDVTVSYIDPTIKGKHIAKLLGKQPGDPLTQADLDKVAEMEASQKGKRGKQRYSRIETRTEDAQTFFDTTSKLAQKDPTAAQQLQREKYGKEYFEDFRQTREGVLDPQKFAQTAAASPAAQIVSKQLAEARDLSNPQSNFRQTLEQSITNPIIESGAEALRESMRYIQNQAAKGGTARRTALKEAQTMLSIERSNRMVAQEMWQKNLAFETWIRDYQRTAVNSAVGFVQGLGVNEYVGAMNSAGRFMAETVAPHTAAYSAQAYQLGMTKKKDNLGKMILGGAMMGASAYSAFKQPGGGGATTMPSQPAEFGGFGPASNMPAYSGPGSSQGPLYTPPQGGQGMLANAPAYGGGVTYGGTQ